MPEKETPRRGRRQLFSRNEIAEAALRIADREGLNAVTMQRVAADLGTAPMTLYGYVSSKDDLLDAVCDFAVAEAGYQPPEVSAAEWRTALRSLMRETYGGLVRHPAIVEIRLRRPIFSSEGLSVIVEQAMQILLRAGMPPEEASAVFRTVITYLFGFAALSPQRQEEQIHKTAVTEIGDLDTKRYPSLTEHGAAFGQAMAGQPAFDHGLDLLLDGIAARLGESTTVDSRPTDP